MRLAYVITRSDEIGGAHIHVRDLALWMISRGHDVCVFVGGEGPFTQLLVSGHINYVSLKYLVRPISPINDYLAVDELEYELNKYSPDLVLCHSAKAGLISRLTCRSLRVPCIFTAHGWAFADGVGFLQRFIYKKVERYLASCCDKIITVCESDRLLAIKHRISSEDHIVAIHNGIPDLEYFKSNRDDGAPVRLIMVARFEKQKDHTSLIKALARIREYSWTLDLVGEGPLLEKIKKLCEAELIKDKVNFLGRRKDVHQLLCRSDIFVLSSLWEGFPLSILEAMRSSLPVVATSVAGVPESVQDGFNGFLISMGDVAQMAQRLQELIGNSKLRQELGSNGRKRFEQTFTFEMMAKKTHNIYTDISKSSL